MDLWGFPHGQIGGEMFQGQAFLVSQDIESGLDGVLQLPHIPMPTAIIQKEQCVRRYGWDLPA